jgi:HAE1 family hydrophobic/amphiphilic exporter-1
MTWMIDAGWKKCLCWAFIALLAGCLGNTPGVLASEEKGVKVLTLDEALRITLEQNKDIQKARQYRNTVEGRYMEERAAALPQLQITGMINHERDESLNALFAGLFPLERQTRTGEIGLSQALYTFGRIGAAIRAAKVGLATAEDQLRIYRQAALRDVSASFYDILLAKELYTIAVQDLEQKVRLLDEARRKYAAGVATEYDLLAAEVAVENAKPGVIRTENLIRISQDKFRFLLGLEAQVDAMGTLGAPLTPSPQYEETLETALKSRPELADLRKRVEVAKELVKIHDAGNMPRLDMKTGYGWRQLILGSLQGSGPEWTAGLYFTFPFFDGLRTQGKVVQAKTDVVNLTIDEGKLKDSVTLQTRDAVNAFRESSEIVMALSGTVKQAERLLSMAEKGYEYGVKTKLEVDDAQVNLNRAKGNLAKARRDYLVARVTLEWVKGTLEVNSVPE